MLWSLEGPVVVFGAELGRSSKLLGGSVLGDGLGALRDGVLGELTGEEKPDSGLDLAGGDGGPLVVVGQTGGLGGDALKDVVHEGVHDGHGLGGDAGVGVDLLEDLVDVDGVGLLSLPLGLLVSLGDVLLGLAGLLGSLSGNLGGHVEWMGINSRMMLGTVSSLLLFEIRGSRSVFRCSNCWQFHGTGSN